MHVRCLAGPRLFIRPSIQGRAFGLGGAHFGALMENEAVDTYVRGFGWAHASAPRGQTPRSGAAER